jgi:phage recombination protein Bet
MNENPTAVATKTQQQPAATQAAADVIEFVPYGGADRVKLNVTIVQTLCAVATKQGHRPTREDAMRFMMLCRAQRLNPFAGDAFLIGYDTKNGPKFNLITAHQAFLKRAEVHPEFDGMASGVIVSPGYDCMACTSTGLLREDNGKPSVCPLCKGTGKRDEVEGDFVPEDQNLVGAWAHVKLKNRSIPTHRRISLQASRPEFGGPIWERNPAMMLVKTVEADALRSTFPTLLGGLYTAGEQPIDLLGENAERSRDVNGLAPPPVTRSLPPAKQTSRMQPPSRRTATTLVEEPLSPDEATEAAMGLAPEQQPPTPAAPAPESTVQDQLAEAVTGAGFTFDQFRQWGTQTQGDGNQATGILAWDTYGGFGDVPAKAAAFFLRAKSGMLTQMKGGGL